MDHPEHSAKCTNYKGQEIGRGSKVVTQNGRQGIVQCILQDGDADIAWADGTFGQAKWHRLELDNAS